MRITVENGWRGPIEGFARMAAVSPRGDLVKVLIARGDIIALPKAGDLFTAGDRRLLVTTFTLQADHIAIDCRSDNNG